MKANELMIGDWIGLDCAIPHFEDKEVRIEQGIMPCQVVKFDEWQVVVKRPDEQFQVELYDAISPIPLTAEILEHNFTDTDDGVSWKQNGDWYEVEIVNDAENEKLRRKFRYVHELQHALRLAGIDKEIEL